MIGDYFWDKELIGRCIGLIIALSYFGFLDSRFHNPVFYGISVSDPRLSDVYKQISALPGVYSVVTSEGSTTFKKLNGESTRTKYYTAVVKVSRESAMNKEFADKIGEIIKTNENIMSENQVVKVVLNGGYSLGIWNIRKHKSFIVE